MKKSEVVAYFGNQTKLAEALGVNKSSISQWPDIIPEKQAFRIERITKGKLKYDPKLYNTAA